ncbi:MAG: M48 family metallopeptidase [Acidobacteria bacterium]|nr:M48 family metallopeptidase [Acidobacteriota bacterium]
MNQVLETIFRTAHRELKPRTPVPDLKVEYFPFAGLNHTARLREGRLIVRVSDLITDAPNDVVHSLALILLAKLYRKKVASEYHQHYRAFILEGEIQDRARVARAARSRVRQTRGPLGRYFDLNEAFDRLNGRYFEGTLEKPRLSWSLKRSRYVLGRYDVAHHTIFISRIFDSPSAPSYALEYVMFHEMLHIKHRSRLHTPEFRSEERKFTHYREAKFWLKDGVGRS